MVSGKNNIHPYEIQTQNQNPEIYISIKNQKYNNKNQSTQAFKHAKSETTFSLV
jgi:hypothetical protein